MSYQMAISVNYVKIDNKASTRNICGEYSNDAHCPPLVTKSTNFLYLVHENLVGSDPVIINDKSSIYSHIKHEIAGPLLQIICARVVLII